MFRRITLRVALAALAGTACIVAPAVPASAVPVSFSQIRAVSSGKCLDVAHASTANKTAVVAYACDTIRPIKSNQLWGVDTLTGENRLLRVDILHDVGRSLNPAVDMGQIEGGFVQGMGWLTTEELVFDEDGRLSTHAPSTYKIPTASDVPEDFRVSLWRSKGNRQPTIYRSKAVGEPPLMLALSVFSAITDAVASLAPGAVPVLDAPATPEAIMRAVRAIGG